MVALQVQLDDKDVLLHINESAVDWFVEHGYSEAMGARPMARLIQDKLKKALAEDILFGELSVAGGDVFVNEENGDIALEIKSRKKAEHKELSQAKN